MNKKEFIQIFSLIKASYPLSNAQFDDTTMAVWYEMLKDLDYATCSNAVTGYIKNNKYMPQIADIREACNKEVKAFVRPYNEAWDDVMQLVRRHGTYGAKEAVEQMDPLTRKVVKNIGFYNICTTSTMSGVKKEFKELYESYKQDIDYETNANQSNNGIECK